MRERIKDARAVTLRMPWAHFVAWGLVTDLAVMGYVPKDEWRGEVMLHAGKEWDTWRFDRMTGLIYERFEKVIHRTKDAVYMSGLDGVVERSGTSSQIPAIATLVDARRHAKGIIWELGNVEPLPLNVTCPGWPGMWTPRQPTKDAMLHAVYGSLEL